MARAREAYHAVAGDRARPRRGRRRGLGRECARGRAVAGACASHAVASRARIAHGADAGAGAGASTHGAAVAGARGVQRPRRRWPQAQDRHRHSGGLSKAPRFASV